MPDSGDEPGLGAALDWLSNDDNGALSDSSLQVVRFFHPRYFEAPSRSGEIEVFSPASQVGQAFEASSELPRPL